MTDCRGARVLVVSTVNGNKDPSYFDAAIVGASALRCTRPGERAARREKAKRLDKALREESSPERRRRLHDAPREGRRANRDGTDLSGTTSDRGRG